jgi:hypothetical protein
MKQQAGTARDRHARVRDGAGRFVRADAAGTGAIATGTADGVTAMPVAKGEAGATERDDTPARTGAGREVARGAGGKAAPPTDAARAGALGRDGSPARAVATTLRRAGPTRKPPVRWSAKREGQFLRALGETANVTRSARAAGFSDSAVYRRRQQSEAFRARWGEALREGLDRLEGQLIERALNGIEREVVEDGAKVVRRVIDDRLALALIRMHRGPARTGGGTVAPLRPAETKTVRRDRITRRLATMNRNMGGGG